MRKLTVIILVIAIAVVSVVPAFAQDYNGKDGPDYFTVDEEVLEQYPYVCVVYSNASLKLFAYDKPLTYHGGVYGVPSTLKPYVDWSKLNGKFYVVSADNESWEYKADTTGSNVSSVVWANYDIYDIDGNLVLDGWIPPQPPKPLAESIIELAGDTIDNDTVPFVNSAMIILCVSGVGLLAMLVLLKLFGKRSLIHR